MGSWGPDQIMMISGPDGLWNPYAKGLFLPAWLCLNPRLANFVFTFGGYDGGKNELAIEVGINNEGDLDIFGTDDILNDWYFYPYAYFL